MSKSYPMAVPGGYKLRAYHSWYAMKQRCNNPKNKRYARYGGRGIKCCERWLQFAGFLEDMGERPEGMTLDRINNDGDYEPGNCRWTDALTQSHNSTRPRLTPETAEKIRSSYVRGKRGGGYRRLARELGVSRGAVRDVITGRCWKASALPGQHKVKQGSPTLSGQVAHSQGEPYGSAR